MDAMDVSGDDQTVPSWLPKALSRAPSANLNAENLSSSSNAAEALDERERKMRFNECIKEQKSAKERGDVAAQIVALEKALKWLPGHEKATEMLQRLKNKVEVSKGTDAASIETIKRDLQRFVSAGADSKEVKAPVQIVDGWKRREGCMYYRLPGKFRLPADVFEHLFQYQRDGVRWLWELHLRDSQSDEPSGGGVLADDMGLGKTVQIASFLRGLFSSHVVETVLIVMPKSVVENWRTEIEKWTKRLVLSYDGTKTQRERSMEEISRKGGVMLTTYGMVRTSADKLAGVENPETGDLEDWDYVILDEGHNIKNSSTEGAKSVKQIGAKHRLILTGTPVLNHLMELWSLFDFVRPGLLGDKVSFRKLFDERIVRASHKNAKPEHKLLGEATLAHLKSVIQPFFLRRVKADVFASTQPAVAASQPSDPAAPVPIAPSSLSNVPRITARKNDFIVWVSLSPLQLELYERFLFMPEVKEILNTSKSPLAAITVLKKICQHPRLLHSNMKTLREDREEGNINNNNNNDNVNVDNVESGEVDALGNLQSDSSEAENKQPPEALKELLKKVYGDNTDAVSQSGKLSFLMQLVGSLLQDRHRILIFSQWQKMLDIIGQVLATRCINYYRIDGSVSKSEDRQRLIDSFNAGQVGAPNVFLLTTQVGGLGITLTGADRAIIYDPSWNPLDDQAVDRIYRIGQTRNCVIYRLISCGTVEEKIYRKQVFKGGLSRMISDPKSGNSVASSMATGRYFTKDELRALFTLDNPFESATQQQLEAKHAHRRVTDEQLDKHLEFLRTIPNFHGVSDHDLLFDNKGATGLSDDSSDQPMSEDVRQGVMKKAQEAIRTVKARPIPSKKGKGDEDDDNDYDNVEPLMMITSHNVARIGKKKTTTGTTKQLDEVLADDDEVQIVDDNNSPAHERSEIRARFEESFSVVLNDEDVNNKSIVAISTPTLKPAAAPIRGLVIDSPVASPVRPPQPPARSRGLIIDSPAVPDEMPTIMDAPISPIVPAAAPAARAAASSAVPPRNKQLMLQARAQEERGDVDGAIATYTEVKSRLKDAGKIAILEKKIAKLRRKVVVVREREDAPTNRVDVEIFEEPGRGSEMSPAPKSARTGSVMVIDSPVQEEQTRKASEIDVAANESQSQSNLSVLSHNSCAICLDGKKEFACVPCGHMVSCAKCSDVLKKSTNCPLCRTNIVHVMRVFL